MNQMNSEQGGRPTPVPNVDTPGVVAAANRGDMASGCVALEFKSARYEEEWMNEAPNRFDLRRNGERSGQIGAI